jgi:putative tricarboxylic transport membrane protein
MQIAQEPSGVGRGLGGHDAHEDPACGAVNGDEQITSGGFIRHLWQVFHVDMKKTRLLTSLDRRQEFFKTETIGSTTLTSDEIKASAMPIVRGSLLGTFFGLIPGIGTILPTVVSYAMEKRLAADPSRFGHGAIEGVAGPETTNNAYANAAMIPLFTLGIPASPTIAVLLGAFMMNGLTPGPFLFRDKPDFVWAVIASLYIGNLILLILNLPLVGIWVRLLRIPYSILFPAVLALTVVGAYVTRNSVLDVWLVIAFGIFGYLARKIEFPVAPMAFTLILGPLTENALRQALSMSDGDTAILARGPLSASILGICALALVWPLVRMVMRRLRPA